MITITNNEYLQYTGRNLDIELRDLDDAGNKVDRVIKLWTNRVYGELTAPVPADDKLTELQAQSIKDAICEYGEYYCKNGDLYRQSGYDEDKGLTISPEELAKIQFPKQCIEILRRSGLIRRGLNTRRTYFW